MGVEALAVALRVATGAAVARRDVEHPVRPEHDRAAVVVGERLGDVHQDDLAVGIAEVGVGGAHGELRDDGVPVAVGVVHEEARDPSGSRGGRPGRADRARRRWRSAR